MQHKTEHIIRLSFYTTRYEQGVTLSLNRYGDEICGEVNCHKITFQVNVSISSKRAKPANHCVNTAALESDRKGASSPMKK